MKQPYQNRSEAGQRLAEELREYADRDDVIVLGIARGGMPVAAEIARELHLPLNVIIVRKLGRPEQPEAAFGAIAAGTLYLDEEGIRRGRISPDTTIAVLRQETEELKRRIALYRQNNPLPDVEGKTVILVDDGLATGATMRTAVRAMRSRGAAKIVAAAPVGASEACGELADEADRVVCPVCPDKFVAVGLWYDDFSEVTDEEIHHIMDSAGPED